MATKQEVFGREIAPLVRQIVEICEKNSIDNVMAFDVHTDERPTLMAVALKVTDDTIDSMHAAASILHAVTESAPVEGEKSLTSSPHHA